jgi:integral membrane protein (TIGR01906 family)
MTPSTDLARTQPGRTLPRWITSALHLIIAVTLPPVLVLTAVQLIMSDVFLQIEYHRPGFPEDRYGFTREDRLTYAPYAIEYLLNDEGIGYLGDLRLDGETLFTKKELQHMEDVKTVTRGAFVVYLGASLALFASAFVLMPHPDHRHALRRGLFDGGALTIGLIALVVLLALTSWDTFFTGFHRVFFEGDSWQFSTSSTLIRLFPEQFWFDAAIAIGVLTVVGALAAMGSAWYWENRNAERRPQSVETAPYSDLPL